jgi:16S rRNA (adenine1518-N6/adenine1519-N6)-dimethyltransferase
MSTKTDTPRPTAWPAAAQLVARWLERRERIDALFDVPPEAFDPPPRVDSAIVRMLPLATPPLLDEAKLSALVTVAFSQRRKLLRHTLGRWLDEQGFAGTFDTQRRAEEVPVAEYVALAQAVSTQP